MKSYIFNFKWKNKLYCRVFRFVCIIQYGSIYESCFSYNLLSMAFVKMSKYVVGWLYFLNFFKKLLTSISLLARTI